MKLNDVKLKIVEVNYLFDEQKKLNKEIKDCNKEIEIEAQKELKNLSYEEICILLNKKWIDPIIDGINKIIDDIINNFCKNIENISNKYSQTLNDIDSEINKVEKDLSSMIDELTGSEYDMKGLEELKKLIGGE